jgi:zinc protease
MKIMKKISEALITKKFIGFGLVFGLLILMMISDYALAGEKKEIKTARTSLSTNVVTKVFSNGLTLLIKPNYDHDLVSVNLFARMGTLYESPSKKGISVLMQRCLLYGGTTNREPDSIYHGLELAGAHWNSSSSLDYGNVWLTVTKSGFERALEIYFDIIRHPQFAAWDVEIGKKERIQQLKTRDDQPFNIVSSLFDKGFYGEHPYSWLTIGSIDTVEALTREDLIEWHSKIYIPNNMVFTVVGNVNPAEIIKKFEDVFGKMKKGRLPKKSSQPMPVLEKDIVFHQPQNIQGAYLVLGYPAPSARSKDAPVMDLIAVTLSNRLYSELRDKRGLVYHASSSYQTMVGPSAITGITVTAPENYSMVRDGIIAEFKKFCDEPVSPLELQSAQKYLKGTFVMSQETNAAQGRLLGIYELLGYGYKYADKYPELIEKVTPEDIRRVARKYFNHYVLAVVAPEGSVEK